MPEPARSSALAAAALLLAERLDAAGHRDTSALARELRGTLAELRLRAAESAGEGVSQLEALRARRLKGA